MATVLEFHQCTAFLTKQRLLTSKTGKEDKRKETEKKKNVCYRFRTSVFISEASPTFADVQLHPCSFSSFATAAKSCGSQKNVCSVIPESCWTVATSFNWWCARKTSCRNGVSHNVFNGRRHVRIVHVRLLSAFVTSKVQPREGTAWWVHNDRGEYSATPPEFSTCWCGTISGSPRLNNCRWGNGGGSY